MLISVVVPTRDRPHLLPGALASVRALEGPDLALEVVVGDNGGLPETAAIAAAFGAKHVLAIRPGAAAARNAGLRAATGEYVAFLDDDDRWLAGHLRPQAAWLEANPAALGAVGQVANVSHDYAEQLGGFWPVDLPRDGHLFAAFLAQYPQIGATVVRRSALARVGGFDERLLYDEDWDWHLRLALAGPVGFVPVPCAHFRQRPPGAHDAL